MDEFFDFVPLVRREFDSFAQRHGMHERQRSDTMASRSVLFVGKGSYVRFGLDVRDGYLSVEYGDTSNLDVYGNVDSALPPRAWAGFVNDLLRSDGVVIPSGPSELYLPGRLAESVREHVAGLHRHEREVFPPRH